MPWPRALPIRGQPVGIVSQSLRVCEEREKQRERKTKANRGKQRETEKLRDRAIKRDRETEKSLHVEDSVSEISESRWGWLRDRTQLLSD